MDISLLDRFREIITDHTGLSIPQRDTPFLGEKLQERCGCHGFPFPERYLSLLEGGTTAGEAEWQELIPYLTTCESYFFRDAGQIKLLRETILPELITQHAYDQRLRLWSAGCAGGEEPYTLALLLHELLPEPEQWQVTILGTDINGLSLQQAPQAHYSQWSFRGMDRAILAKYFQKKQEKWQLKSGIRDQVTFQHLNLAQDRFPDRNRDLYDMDLILCRNVFIYFSPQAIARVVKQFATTLRPGGYLLTGHGEMQPAAAELSPNNPASLSVQNHPGSVIYQRPRPEDPAVSPAPQGPPPLPLPIPLLLSLPPPTAFLKGCPTPAAPASLKGCPTPAAPILDDEMLMAKAELLFADGLYDFAMTEAERVLRQNREHIKARFLLARIQANLGNGQRAEGHCREALRIDPFAPGPHFLLAHILLERNQVEEAKKLLKKTIYLDHAHVPAFLELAAIHQENGDKHQARRMRLAALDALRTLPPDSRLESYEAWTVAELTGQLRLLVDQKTPGGGSHPGF